MVTTFNAILSQAPDSATVPSINDANKVYYHKSGDYMQYKVRPEIDAEERVYALDQTKSIIEVMGLQEDPFWKKRVEFFKTRYKPTWLKQSWNWEDPSQGSSQGWRTGSSKRAYSAPVRKS